MSNMPAMDMQLLAATILSYTCAFPSMTCKMSAMKNVNVYLISCIFDREFVVFFSTKKTPASRSVQRFIKDRF